MPEPHDRNGQTIHINADKARGAEIILTKSRNRAIFIAGLAGFMLLGLMLYFLA